MFGKIYVDALPDDIASAIFRRINNAIDFNACTIWDHGRVYGNRVIRLAQSAKAIVVSVFL